jgi:ABC-type glycerol-3-phosphate transport system substrate-binding protein
MMSRLQLVWFIIILLLLGVTPLQAQETVTPITISIAEFLVAGLRPVLQQYDEQHPDIRLVIVSPEEPILVTDEPIASRLDAFEAYIRQADIHIGISPFDPITTRAGYFLNLDTFTRADPTFNNDDFYAGMLASYQWEGGTWALPIASDLQLMYYDPAAFDAASLQYPDGSWTVDDLREVAAEFAANTPDGAAVTTPIHTFYSVTYLSLLGLTEPLYDPNEFEIQPTINELELQSLFERWLLLESEGLMTRSFEVTSPIILGSASSAEMILSAGYQIAPIPATFPTVQPMAAGINAGTAYPQEAYELVRFLTESPEVFQALFTPIPARKSLAASGTVAIDADILALAETAKPYTNYLFFWYLWAAYAEISGNGVDVQVALTDAQAHAVDDLEAAQNRVRADLTVAVPELVEGDFRFGVASPFASEIMPLWETAATEFNETHPEIEQVQIVPIDISLEQPLSQAEIAAQAGCFYTPATLNTNESLSSLLALNPLLATDSTMNADDFPPRVLARLTDGDLLYGFPLSIQPQVIAYNIDQLAAHGITLPQHGWTTADFETLLRLIRDNPANPPALDTRSTSDAYLLNLIASYGAVPIDFRTDPPTIDFTSERSMSAIRQVLDLQKEGYVLYNAHTLHSDSALFAQSDETPLHIQFFNPIHNNWATMSSGIDIESGNYGMVLFPQGLEYSAIDYDLGAAYITPDTIFMNACYEFIKFVSERPDVYEGVPARTSVLSSDIVQQLESAETIAFYHSVHERLRQPNVIEFPYGGTYDSVVYAEGFVSIWLLRAMTRYLFEAADLEAELLEAEDFTLAYLGCIAPLPPYDPTTQEAEAYVELYRECFRAIDPSI